MTDLTSIEEEQAGVRRPEYRLRVELTHTDPDYTDVVTLELEHDDPHALARAGTLAVQQALPALFPQPTVSNDPARDFTSNGPALLLHELPPPQNPGVPSRGRPR